jgi:crotonobetainyl-CoA:carnitine CoA-transferase CaiB-like acyl-CoA transferase
MQDDKPLAGLTVLDASQGIAGPSCASHFAQYGARVIKIEPPEGDWIRHHGTQIAGTSPPAIAYNRGKESLCLDLKRPEARDVALKLARGAQVFIESSRPGVMDRLGLGFEHIKSVNPDIIYLSISGWGQKGPNRELPMVDTVGQAVSGLMSVTLSREGSPVKINATLIDAVTGLYAFQATSMALWNKRPGSGARHIDINLLQSAAHMMIHNILEYAFVGRAPGLLNPPAGNYRTKDSWLAVTLVTEAQFGGICKAIGQPELAREARFNSFQARKANIADLTEILDAALVTRTTEEWLPLFAAAGALASRVYTHGDWLDHPQVTAVGAAPPYPLADGGSVRIPHLPGTAPFDAPVPRIGEHTRALLAEAGLSTAEIARLIASGAARAADEASASARALAHS